jgi:aspartate/methionine/tyrosine aminotransferase
MVPGPVQAAVTVAYRDDEHVERATSDLPAPSGATESDALERIRRRRAIPEGSFYLWCSKEGLDGWQLAELIAERSGLVVSPGELYGEAGADFIRLAVVQPDDRLGVAASRLRGQ